MESSNLCCVAAGKRRHGARGHGGSCGCSQLGPALPVSQRCCHRHHHHPGAGSAPAAPRPSPMVSVGCALTPCPVPVSSRFLLLFFFSFSFFFFFFPQHLPEERTGRRKHNFPLWASFSVLFCSAKHSALQLTSVPLFTGHRVRERRENVSTMQGSAPPVAGREPLSAAPHEILLFAPTAIGADQTHTPCMDSLALELLMWGSTGGVPPP